MNEVELAGVPAGLTARRRPPGSDPARPRIEEDVGVADRDVPVLVVGGSLVGLSTALFLADQGITPVVVERHPGPAIHPRAALFFQRTVELWRSVGLEDEIVTASGLEFEQNGAVMSVESLGGEEVEWFFRHVNEGVEQLSPSPRLFVTQNGPGRASPRSSATAKAGKTRRSGPSTWSRPTGRTARSASAWAFRCGATGASRTASRSTSART